MSLGITWYELEDAAAKFCLDKTLILRWVDEGLVRAEKTDTRSVRVNLDDLQLKIQESTRD